MKIRIIKENTQPFEGKTKYFLKENVAEIDIDELFTEDWLADRLARLLDEEVELKNEYSCLKNLAWAVLHKIKDELEQFLREKLNIE